MNNAQELADEIKRLVLQLRNTSRLDVVGCQEEVHALHAAIDKLASLAAPQPTEPLTGTESPDYQAGWKAGYKHGAWSDGKREPFTRDYVRGWNACREAALASTKKDAT